MEKEFTQKQGVKVIEYSSDYSKAVEEGRRQSHQDSSSYFVDDEHSMPFSRIQCGGFSFEETAML